jgi:hypothetical protein
MPRATVNDWRVDKNVVAVVVADTKRDTCFCL